MNSKQRREDIVARLNAASEPITATYFAKQYGVSRQTIVHDIEVIRATGVEVVSLARGYLIQNTMRVFRIFEVKHTDEQTREELVGIIERGGEVKDVFVYHKVYGRLRAVLNVSSYTSLKRFMNEIGSGKVTLLKNLTSSNHFHTVFAEDEETLDEIEGFLNSKGFLVSVKKEQ